MIDIAGIAERLTDTLRLSGEYPVYLYTHDMSEVIIDGVFDMVDFVHRLIEDGWTPPSG